MSRLRRSRSSSSWRSRPSSRSRRSARRRARRRPVPAGCAMPSTTREACPTACANASRSGRARPRPPSSRPGRHRWPRSPRSRTSSSTGHRPAAPPGRARIALNLDDPMNAVAASNDYTGDGFWIGYTTDGGQTWTSQWKDPKFSFDGGRCFASDPAVAYSLRDARLLPRARSATSPRRRPPRSTSGNPSTAVRRGPTRRSRPSSSRITPRRRHSMPRSSTTRSSWPSTTTPSKPVLRTDLRHLHEVPHDRRLVRAQRLLPDPGRLHRQHPDANPSDSVWQPHRRRSRRPRRRRPGCIGEPVLHAARRRDRRAQRRVRERGLQHVLRSRAPLRTSTDGGATFGAGRSRGPARRLDRQREPQRQPAREGRTSGSPGRSRSPTTPRVTGSSCST